MAFSRGNPQCRRKAGIIGNLSYQTPCCGKMLRIADERLDLSR
jgi:hypothetical protein